VPAEHSYVVVSTMTGNERLITTCSSHADQLDNGKLSYTVVTGKKGFDWTSGAEENSGDAKAGP
jgi:hypothetical protein